jgi:hypothetical protein
MGSGNCSLSTPRRLRTTTVKASPYDRNILHVAGPNDCGRHPNDISNRCLKGGLHRSQNNPHSNLSTAARHVAGMSIHHARPRRMDVELIFDTPKTNSDKSYLPNGIKMGHCRRAQEPCAKGGTVFIIGRQHAYVTTLPTHNSRFYDN